MARGRFLVLDDESMLADRLARLVRRHGEVTVAATAREADRLLAMDVGWRGFIFDIRLPDGSGLGVLARARPRHPTTPALVISGYLEPKLVNVAYDLDAAYVVKPVLPARITRFVTRAAHVETVVRAVHSWVSKYDLSGAEADVLLRAASGQSREAIDFNTFFGDINWTQNIFTAPGFNLATFDSDTSSASGRGWPESSNLRLGTWSVWGTPDGLDDSVSPLIEAEVPSTSAPFFTMPPMVLQCVADTTQSQPVPPPCPAPTTTGQVPNGHMCAWIDSKGASNACNNISGWESYIAQGFSPYLGATDPYLLDILTYVMCTGAHVENSMGQVSHLLTSADFTRLGNDLYQPGSSPTGVTVDEHNNGATNQQIAAWLPIFLNFSPCDQYANLQSGSSVVSVVGGTTSPTVASGQSCN